MSLIRSLVSVRDEMFVRPRSGPRSLSSAPLMFTSASATHLSSPARSLIGFPLDAIPDRFLTSAAVSGSFASRFSSTWARTTFSKVESGNKGESTAKAVLKPQYAIQSTGKRFIDSLLFKRNLLIRQLGSADHRWDETLEHSSE